MRKAVSGRTRGGMPCVRGKVLLLAVSLLAFARTADAQEHTVTVDVGPTIFSMMLGSALNSLVEGEDRVSFSSFGIGIAYERPVLEKVSAGGRFFYFGYGAKATDSDGSVSAGVTADIYSWGLEGHGRFYPNGGAFFVDGTLGYAMMTAAASGGAIDRSDNRRVNVSLSASRSYLKLGAKLGWRLDFGEPGGFVFEPSFGYDLGLGIGAKLGDALAKNTKSKYGQDVDISNIDDLNTSSEIIANTLFIGGPRIGLALGWSF